MRNGPFEYPSQRLQDWLSQQWVMWRGRRVDPADVPWLRGPYGHVDVIGDRYVERLADEEGLTIDRNVSGAGLLPSIDALALPEGGARVRPEIARFYEATADHDLDVWSEWNPLFRPFGGLVLWLYSRRLQQLNLPLKPLETSRGIRSEILQLRDATGTLRYTVWYRVLVATGRVIYSGLYGTCTPPDGPTCVKVVFPLPRGNATVIMAPEVGERGDLTLVSSGRRFGDAGFYFLLVDARGRHWAQYLRTFRERIHLFLDEAGRLRTDHTLTLWGRRVLELHYKIVPRG